MTKKSIKKISLALCVWVCYKCTLYNHVIYYMICLICTIVCWVCYKCTLYNHNLHKYISLYDMPDLDNYVCVLLAYCVSMRLSLSLCFLLCTVMCTLCMCQLNGPPKVCWSLMFCSCFFAAVAPKQGFSRHISKTRLFSSSLQTDTFCSLSLFI